MAMTETMSSEQLSCVVPVVSDSRENGIRHRTSVSTLDRTASRFKTTEQELLSVEMDRKPEGNTHSARSLVLRT